MRSRYVLITLVSWLLLTCESAEKAPAHPNIVLVLADDLGYGELGFQGQTWIKTPNLDALAATGRVFTDHYSAAPVCAPARYMLLTGLHGGHAYIRGNDEWDERGAVWDYAAASADPALEGQRPIPADTRTLAKMLQENGYATALVGKWGLGAPQSEGVPNKLGFDYFFGYNCQRQAHNLYPPHLWENEEKIPLRNAVVAPRTPLPPGADPMDPMAYRLYEQQDYAPYLMEERALQFMEEHQDQPFFLYFASPLPHLPLQVPTAELTDYLDLPGDSLPYDGSKGYFPNRYPRATYAAMITLLDRQIGALRDKLEALGLLENTLFMVTSDNGPTYTGGVDAAFFNSAAPFFNDYGRTKGFVYEGGIRVPLVVNWPGRIQPGTQSDQPSTLYDYFATFCDLLGLPAPEDTDGVSFLPAMLGQPQPERPFLYWDFPEYGGQQALRMGKWKAVRQKLQEGTVMTELYDLSSDPTESKDLSAAFPDIVRQMEAVMTREHRTSPIPRFQIKALDQQAIPQ
jgi:arylsulfatase A-like enzyme